MFDVLVSADLLVDDFAAAVAGLQQRLGFGEAKPGWFGGKPTAGSASSTGSATRFARDAHR